MAGCVVIRMRSAVAMLCLAITLWLLSMKAEAGGSNFVTKYCDEHYIFAPSEDLNFVHMLDNLLAASRKTFLGKDVSAKDNEGMFEGRAGCLWQSCQIYDGECYDCHSVRDAGLCIENVISEMKQGLRQSNADCRRTREFGSGERSVAVDDASTNFQVCGIQYRYLGKDYMSASRASF